MSVKSFKFTPFPASKEEAKLDRAQWTGEIDIPEDTRVRVEALPGRNVVFDGLVTGSFTKNFDPGKYVYVMEKFIAPRKDGSPGRSLRTEGEFLVDVTEEQFGELCDYDPQRVRGRMTTDGARWICTVPGCGRQSETRLSAFLHESRAHLGIDPIAEPQKAVMAELKSKEARKAEKAVYEAQVFGE